MKGSMCKFFVDFDGDNKLSRYMIFFVGSIEEILEKRLEIGVNFFYKNGEGILVNEFLSFKEVMNFRNSKSKVCIFFFGFESVVVGIGGCN